MRCATIRVCRSVWAKGTGLMLRWPPRPFAYIFPFRTVRKIRITMFLVFYPIDVVVLDANGRVTALHRNLRPFWHLTVTGATFIELPAGTIDRQRIRVGKQVSWTHTELSFT